MQFIERPLNTIVKQHISRYLPPWLADIVARRLDCPQTANQLLKAGLAQLPNPNLLPDMEQAVAYLTHAISQQHNILCVVDYDTDGICSGAILQGGLRQLGARVNVMVTHRHEDGYGFSAGACARILAMPELPNVIVTADLGSSDGHHIADLQQQAQQRGTPVQVIVTDHHHISQQTPPSSAQAFINPHRQDISHHYPYPICGAMVAWNLIAALRTALRQQNNLPTYRAMAEACDTAHLLDLVAIATIADMVDLSHPINRAIVRVGLQRINQRQRPAWQLLSEALGTSAQITEETIGFQISPRINALSRMGDDGHTALTWLTTTHMSTCQQAWAIMSQHNEERKDEQAQCEALALLQAQVQQDRFILVIHIPQASHGVVGLAAGKLAQRFGRPTIVLAPNDDQQLTGSARSIPGYDIRHLLERIQQQTELLNKYGGHAAAAGLSIAAQHLPALSEALEQQIRLDFNQRPPQACLHHDGDLPQELHTLEGIQQLSRLSPFGQGFPAPAFCITAALISYRTMGKQGQHTRLHLRTTQADIHAVWFNTPDNITLTVQHHYRCVLQMTINHFRGEQTPQAIIHNLLPLGISGNTPL